MTHQDLAANQNNRSQLFSGQVISGLWNSFMEMTKLCKTPFQVKGRSVSRFTWMYF